MQKLHTGSHNVNISRIKLPFCTLGYEFKTMYVSNLASEVILNDAVRKWMKKYSFSLNVTKTKYLILFAYNKRALS